MLHLETKVIYRLAAISNTKVRIGRELTFMDCRDQGVNPWTKELSVFPSSPKDWLCILVSSNVGTYLRINLSGVPMSLQVVGTMHQLAFISLTP